MGHAGVDRTAELADVDDALAQIEGVAQVLEHFGMNGGIDVAVRNGQMFTMLASSLIEAVDAVRSR